ncbi:serine/threonine-protein kinase [Wenzhouxiangella marina]|uniref:Protein kinase domain-containing protein n=1 Tax=Wenzhouxiangella marina TaxID=1579979 RepID=A0A0K0XZS5_9GAMM|nr:serine/threonine-protein kinase [Wenzhouxiangella marina]AKS43142.1 hypothetical protein WM2015_2785 [Wenzhouxiangella marina]MBB6087173.1 serine/threonine-protein kinase [Wenzhouxiangella marina]
MPKVLGRYHIISELGRGGMGVVYKAVDPKLERFIAIKCLSDELSNDEITVTRFLREARNVAALNHPHIAQIFLADEDEGKPYFVMEFIDGESLADRLERDVRLLPEQARRIITECAQALKAAWEENIVHRDIKPGNIMIDRRGRSVLTDFGIASIVHPDAEQTTSKYIMGTPGYLPPEVITGKPADHRGDIFALGAVYYEMLAGKRLVPGSGLEDTARTLLASDFPELGDLDETLDEKTFGVLGRMLAPDPSKRYQDYDALLADLGVASEISAQAAPRAPAPPPVDAPTAVTPAPAVASAGEPSKVATQTIDPTVVQPPITETSVPARSGSKAGLAVFVVLVLVGLAASGFAVVKFAPAQIERVTAMLGLSSDDPIDQGEVTVAGSRVNETIDDFQDEPARPLSEPAQTTVAQEADAPVSAPFGQEPDSDPGLETSEAGEPGSTIERGLVDQTPIDTADAVVKSQAAPTESATLAADKPLVVASVDRRPQTQPVDTMPEPVPVEPPPPPEGVLVIGQGDGAITDPMVRAIEQALTEDGHALVERGFVPGLAAVLGEAELDLVALAELGVEAGARYAVIARALPAGQRQLNFYGRSDTAYIVQADTVVFDLVERRRVSSTEVEQIEYTALNATQRAQALITPRLARISADLED